MSQYHVVVHDPSGTYWDGSLVEQNGLALVRGHGGIALPVDHKAVQLGAVGGWMKRSYGAGWPLDYLNPQLACRLCLALPVGLSKVHWSAMLLLGPKGKQMLELGTLGTNGEGVLSMTGDMQPSLLSTAFAPSTDPIALKKLESELKQKGHALVGGRGEVRTERSGVHGFALYGTMPGMRVAWAAISAEARP